jgi:MtrB/PioB family decaheme-associated outer membrane protein
LRIAPLVVVLGIALLPPAVGAQPAPDSNTATVNRGFVDIGLRGTDMTGDGARYERYRDLGNGGFLEAFRLERVQSGWSFDLAATHAGRRDQRFTGTVTRPGRFNAWFTWDQIPMLMSRETRALFDGISTGALTIPDALQAQVQANPANLAPVFANDARTFDTKSRRHIADGGFRYLATPELTVNAKIRFTDREGVIPYGGSFGHGSLVETMAPVSHRLTDIDLGGEFTRGRLLARAGYTASLFRNDFTTLEFNSPFRLTDIAATPANGRHSLPPSNSSFGVNGLVSVQMPRRSRATAYVSVGSLSDAGDAIMPQTINSANQALITPLDRTTVEGEARTTTLNLTFTSRPTRWADARVRYRSYDYDNRTPEFAMTQRVAYDARPSAVSPAVHSEPFGVVRHDFDAELKLAPVNRASAAIGFSRLEEERSHRIFESTTENILRLGLDSVGNQYFSLRSKYEHGQKRGSGLDTALLVAAHEQTGMRHFDVASRDRDRVTILGSLTPTSTVAVNASIAAGKDNYIESVFGLRDNTHRVYSVGLDVAPSVTFTFAPSYSFERYNALSRSRQANPGVQFDDASRNWATDATDRVHSFLLSAGLTQLADKVDVLVSYDYNKATATYNYITGAVPNRTLPDELVVDTTLPPPTQLPPTLSQLNRATADITYAVTGRVSLGFSYWYEDYKVKDFTLDADANLDLVRGQILLIGYLYKPYTANTFWGRLIYRW